MTERSRFASFFEEVHGYQPFPWQADIAERLVAGTIPSTIDVPTGLGKTNIISAWAYALARQRALNVKRTVPMRLAFVVDRRLIVDATTEVVRRLKSALEAPTGGHLAQIAEDLRADMARGVLEITRMRGGASWDAVWLSRPDIPAVIVGTVDQFASRLLFRGYGTSEGLRPIDAALLGVDCWLVVDEAHLSAPLLETTRSVSRYQALGEVSRQRPLVVTAMSATAPADEGSYVADLEAQTKSEDFPTAAEEARRRLYAAKPAHLVKLAYLDGSSKGWLTKARSLGEDMAEIAIQLAPSGGVTGVICNTVVTARAAHERFLKKRRNAILLIGRCRQFERDRILDDWFESIRAGATDRAADLFVVATQTIEVGADIDFDCIVSEAAPMSSLMQRFGRVNRIGSRDEPVASAIVYAPVAHDEDVVYGPATARAWSFITKQEPPRVVDHRNSLSVIDWDSTLDFGVIGNRMRRESAPDDVEPLPPFTPTAIGSHFERWAATSPQPLQDVDPDPFIRGVGRPHRDVTVLWRVSPPGLHATTSREEIEAAWHSWLALQPPIAAESVEVPIWELARLLFRTKGGPLADVALIAEDGFPRVDDEGSEFKGVVWQGSRLECRAIRSARDVTPGDWVVLDSEMGGHDDWGWTGTNAASVADVGDAVEGRRRFRWDGRTIAGLVPGDRRKAAFAAVVSSDLPNPDIEAGDSGQPSVPDLVALLEPWRAYLPLQGLEGARLRWNEVGGAWVPWLDRQGFDVDESLVSDESEHSSSVLGLEGQLPNIYEHGLAVGGLARRFAEEAGLPAELVDAVTLAGEWHDLGKADPRFQAMLVGGDRLAAVALPSPLAKSALDPRSSHARRAARLARLPRGFRHEAVSARIVDELIAAGAVPPHLDSDLVRHLVVSHHGRSRPLLPPLQDGNAPQVELEVAGRAIKISGATTQVDWAQPQRFNALNERYGWWGLALLETIVRLADMAASREGR